MNTTFGVSAIQAQYSNVITYLLGLLALTVLSVVLLDIIHKLVSSDPLHGRHRELFVPLTSVYS